jgi:hypothetical protein
MRTPLNALITEKSLRFISVLHNSDLADAIANDPDHDPQTRGFLKNVCAKVSIELSDDIDQICGLLSISKRAFLEAAMSEAVSKAKGIMEREGVWESIKEDQDGKPTPADYDASRALDSNEGC